MNQKALDLYHLYLAIGGLPHAVKTYRDTHDFDFVQSEQKNLKNAYIADMAKYAAPQETTRRRAVGLAALCCVLLDTIKQNASAYNSATYPDAKIQRFARRVRF